MKLNQKGKAFIIVYRLKAVKNEITAHYGV